VVRSEHRSEYRDDRVERRVGKRQRLGVTFEQLDVEPFDGGALAAALEERGDVVDPDRGGAEPGRGDRGIAAAGGDVQHTRAGVQVGCVDEVLGDEHDPRGDGVEVAARPRLLLALLDRGEVGRGG
jgi:hypothetical protein